MFGKKNKPNRVEQKTLDRNNKIINELLKNEKHQQPGIIHQTQQPTLQLATKINPLEHIDTDKESIYPYRKIERNRNT